MLPINQLIEIANTEDLTTRSERILTEIQPILRSIMDSFIANYGETESYLRNLKVHTYESSLRTTIADSKNPKYAEKKQNYSRRAFVELIDEQYFEAPLFILKLEVDLHAKQVQIYMSSDFFPFWVHYKKSRVQPLEQMVQELDVTCQIFTGDENIPHEDLIKRIQEYRENKRTPRLYLGKVFSFEEIVSERNLVDELWSTYQMLAPVRRFVAEEAKAHSEGMHFLNLFKKNSVPFQITLFSRNYKVITESELKKIKTNEFRQSFSIYDNEQLITTGSFLYYDRDPKEDIGVEINKRAQIYSSIRDIANSERYEWYNKKSFYHRGKYNENQENQIYQERSLRELKDHGFTIDDSGAFYIGTYEKEKHSFTEPIEEVKKRLIIASAIFADIREFMTFPKGEPVTPIDNDDSELDDIEQYNSSFNFTNIMDYVEQSGFTFSIDIIRDFYLNLTSLEDKHFVILNGISGTGKTQLCRVFANAVYGLDYSADHPYLKIIPVHPDWTDSTSLLGYYSSFEKRYMKTEFLEMLLQANEQKDKPHFVVLDEMNLARVEYYLSNYLSGIESRKPIQLHNVDNVTDVPKTIEIPHNFYLIGTINVDETTHSLSDKVLDRAFVMTLSDVNFDEFWKTLDAKMKETLHDEWELLLELHEKLAQHDLHFGYRTMNEILKKLYKNSQLPEEVRMDKWTGLERAISEKILPKLRGDERIEVLLNQLEDLMRTKFKENSESIKHLVRMRKELERYGATQFWR